MDVSSAFVSYSRRDAEIAVAVAEALSADGRQVWFDTEDIPDLSEWKQEIQAGIDKADAVIFLMSPEFCASKECGVEREFAEAQGKRLVPVVVCAVTYDEVAASLAKIQWIRLDEPDGFEEGLQQLKKALDTDLEWVQLHTAVHVRATQYTQRENDSSLLLRGRQLLEAERTFGVGVDKDPKPTKAQVQFLAASRRAANRRQRLTFGALASGLIISITLGIVALLQRDAAREARDDAQHRLYASQMLLAREQADEDPATAFDTLRAADWAAGGLHEFTWDLLANQTARIVFTTGGLRRPGVNRGGLYPMALSHDGRHLAVATTRLPKPTEDARAVADIRIWDVDTGGLIQTLTVQRSRIRDWTPFKSLHLSADAKRVAAIISRPSKIQVWDVDTGKSLLEYSTGDDVVRFPPPSVASNKTSRPIPALLTVGVAGVTVWDDLEAPPREIGNFDFLNAFAFLPDRTGLRLFNRDSLATMNFATEKVENLGEHGLPWGEFWDIAEVPGRVVRVDDDRVEIWEAAIGTTQWTRHPLARSAHGGRVTISRLSADGRWIVTGGTDDRVIIWDAEQRRRALSFAGLRGDVLELSISGDGSRVAAAGDDGSLIVWDIASAAVEPAYRFDRSVSRACQDVSANGSVLWAENGEVRLRSSNREIVAPSLATAVSRCTVSQSGEVAMLASDSGQVSVWHPKDERMVNLPMPRVAHDIRISPEGSRVVAVFEDGIRHWETEGGTLTGTIELSAFRFLQFGGETLVAGIVGKGDEEAFTALDLDSGVAVVALPMPDPVKSVATCPSRGLVAVASRERVDIFRLDDGEKLPGFEWRKLSGPEHLTITPQALAFSPDCVAILLGDSEGRLSMWEIAHGTRLFDVQAHTGPIRVGGTTEVTAFGVTSLAVSPNGRTIASGGGTESGRGELKLWHSGSGLLLAELPATSGTTREVRFSKDGGSLTVRFDPSPRSGANEIFEVWDARSRLPYRVTNAHDAPVIELELSKDGMEILSRSTDSDEGVRTWHIQDDGLHAVARGTSWWALTGLVSSWSEPEEISPATVVEFTDGGWLRMVAADGEVAERIPPATDITRRMSNIFKAVVVPDEDRLITLYKSEVDGGFAPYKLVEWRIPEGTQSRETVIASARPTSNTFQLLPGTSAFLLGGAISEPIGAAGYVEIWNSASLRPVAKFHGHQTRVTALLVLREHGLIIAGDLSGTLHVWPLPDGISY